MTGNERPPGAVSAAMRFAAVILGLLTMACLAACAGSPIAPPGGVQPVVTVEFHGGMCGDLGECRNTFVIRSDGAVVDPAQPMVTATAEAGQFARLMTAIATTDFRVLAARPFTGTCPTAFDGQEVIFTFRLPSGDVRLASCEVEIDPDQELFLAIREVLRAAEGPTN